MGQEYGFVYAVITAFCMIYAIIVFTKLDDDIGSEREILYFKRMIIAYVAFTASEVVWALGNFGTFAIPVPVLFLMSSISLIAVGFISFYWFAYGETKMGYHVVGRPVMRAIVYTPLIIVTALYIVSMFNGVMFSYDANGRFVHGPLYESAVFFDDIYLVVVSVHAFIKGVRETNPVRRHEYITLFAFIILPTLAGLIDMFAPNLPLIGPAIFSSILLVFSNVQESQIFNDALTGLNNRRRADAYLEERIEQASPDNAFYAFMIDADKFKNINDTYGHLQGDRALVALADAIRSTCKAFPSFVARWGGDEFVTIVGASDIPSPQQADAEFQHNLAQAAKEAELPCALEATVGWARCDSASATPADIIAQADAMLYERKQAKR